VNPDPLPSDTIDGWWTDPRLAFAEGARIGFAAGMAEALEVAAQLYGPWKFDAAAVIRGVEARHHRTTADGR
jgi:hypothetical protein